MRSAHRLSLFATNYCLGGSLCDNDCLRTWATLKWPWNQIRHSQHIQPKPPNLLNFFQQ